MFSAAMARRPKRINPPSNQGFSGWEMLLAPLIQATSTVYTVGQTKDIEQAKVQAQASIVAMQESTKRLELELQEKQLELLSAASEEKQLMSAGMDLTSPKTLAILGGAGLGIGLLTYLLLKK